jgi:hypothetical protein
MDVSFNTKDKYPTYVYLYIIGGVIIAYTLKRIIIILRNTGEAEYYALSEAARKAAGIRNFIIEF